MEVHSVSAGLAKKILEEKKTLPPHQRSMLDQEQVSIGLWAKEASMLQRKIDQN